jgi:hypothetical protein
LVLLVRTPLTVVWLLADNPPVKETLLTVGASHSYLALAGTITVPPFTGDTTKGIPLHVTVLNGLITGVGLTYTVNVNVE